MILALVAGSERAAPLTLKISSEVERPPAGPLQKHPQQKRFNTCHHFFLIVIQSHLFFFFFFLNLIYLFSNWISFKLDYRSLMKSRHHKSGWLCCLDCPTDLEQHRINNIYQPSLGDVKNELCNRWRQTQLLEEESSTQQLQSVNQWTGPSVGKASAGSTWCLSQSLSGSGG